MTLTSKKLNHRNVPASINTSVAHNMHHKKFHGNYGLYTLIWHRLFGTLRKDYDVDFEEATNKKGDSLPLASR